MNDDVLLSVRRLNVKRGWRTVVSELDFDVRAGERIHVVGENGSGKSTLLEALIGLLPSVADSRRWLTESRTPEKSGALARNELVYVPQTNNLFPSLTVRENLLLSSPVAQSVAVRQLEAVLDHFPEVRRYVDRKPAQLSAGQRQFAAAARALLFRPKLLVMDEPTAGMDPDLIESFHKLLPGTMDGATAVLVTDQHVDVVRRWVTRVFTVVAPSE